MVKETKYEPYVTPWLTWYASLNMHFIIYSMAGSIKLTSSLLFAEVSPSVVSFSDIILINKTLMSLMQHIRYSVMELSNKQQCKFPEETWCSLIVWKDISDSQLQDCQQAIWTILLRIYICINIAIMHMFVFPKIEKVSFTSLRTENDCKIWDCLNFPGQNGNKSNTEKGQNAKFHPKWYQNLHVI